jgi:LysM repeat protein
MKRHWVLVCSLSLGLLTWIPTRAQVDAEDLRRMNATVEALTEGQETLRRQIQELRDAVLQLRQENSQLKQQLRSTGDMVTRDQLRDVVKSIQMVDEKRAADGEYVRRQLESIAKDVSKALVPPARESQRSTGRPSASKEPKEVVDAAAKLPDKQYVHKVQSGETLGAIIAAYNKEYELKVKVSDVLAANPGLRDPKLLRVGQEVNIPAVK